MKKETFLYILMIVIFALVFDFIGAKVHGRILEKKEAAFARQKELEKEVRIQVPAYHHGLKPYSEVVAGWGPRKFTLTTNSLGFRDQSKREVAMHSEKHRILFMGDSFTEGVGLNYEKTFVGILDQKLRAQNIEVLNAGLSSYSPILYHKKIKHLLETVGLAFEEVILFLDISDIHDETLYQEEPDGTISREPSESELRQEPISTRPRWKQVLLQNSLTMRLIAFYREVRARVQDPDNLKRSRRSSWTYDSDYFEDYGQKGLQTAEHYMNELANLLKAHEIRLTVAVYPWPVTIDHHDLNPAQVTFWRAWSKKNNAVFINYFPVFIGDKKDVLETIRTYFIPGDYHWNAAGHALIADVLWKDFLEGNMPAALQV